MPRLLAACLIAFLLPSLPACVDSGGRDGSASATVESCMKCHNGSKDANYEGPGIENPHPFPGADSLACTTCHGGNGGGTDRVTSHVPPPPQIGDRQFREQNREAFFNRLTLTGIDRYPDYVVDGTTYSALDYLQFINPGDLRVVTRQRSCGQCHESHAESVAQGTLATETGIFSGAMYAVGVQNAVPANRGLYQNTAADLGFRAVTDPSFDPALPGAVSSLVEFPVYSVRGDNDISDNPDYDAANLDAGLNPDNSVVTGSPLADLLHEQVAFTCGDCHLGSAGANNRYGDFRSSGCTSCHMRYSLDGRSRSQDPNVRKDEPVDPDAIDAPERPHVRSHRIASVNKTLAGGRQVDGIDDYACAGCHQGSNRTVMQYWGIRLDQNQDLRNRDQYPANPATFRNTSGDARLFDPAVGNRTFNGRNANQYILYEDYDGDGRDDTPPDVHYEAGLGCIDCHGGPDLHGGARISSRMEHGVAIRCESCHGGVDAYAQTAPGTGFAMDADGNPLTHVALESDGNFYLTSRVTGKRHFVPQTRDTVVDSGRVHPLTQQPIYSAKASYAMGRDDGQAGTGLGPQQAGAPSGFSHSDTMDCASCHASWTNTCMGCHLEGEYDTGNNFSNITGQRIVFRQKIADFVYQSPLFFQLGINARNRITQTSSNTKMFFRYEDQGNNRSRVFAFTDRNGGGNDPATPFPSLGHNAMMAHSIRGKVSAANEGPRYCVACHLTQQGVADHGPLYDAFRAAMANHAFDQLDFDELRNHFGNNPGNQLDSPLWVHMVAGLGSGLFLFDASGRPMNPLDDNANRKGTDGVAPSSIFDPSRVAFNLDRVVGRTGSSNHAILGPGPGAGLAGPLGANLANRLADPNPLTGIVLDSWIDADGQPRGGASNVVK